MYIRCEQLYGACDMFLLVFGITFNVVVSGCKADYRSISRSKQESDRFESVIRWKRCSHPGARELASRRFKCHPCERIVLLDISPILPLAGTLSIWGTTSSTVTDSRESFERLPSWREERGSSAPGFGCRHEP